MTKISAALLLSLGMTLAGGLSSAFAADTIKIGAMMPLTGGAVSVIGADMRRGFEMALKEANDKAGANGPKFELVIGDDQGNATVGVGLAQRLLVRDQVSAIVGLASSTVLKAVGNIAAQHKKPLLAVGAASPLIEDAFGKEPWFFHFIPWEYARAETAVSVLSKLDPKPESVAIAYENGVYGTGSAPLLKEKLEASGFKVVAYESFQSGSPSLLPLLSNVKSKKPDVFFVVGFPTDNVLIARQSREVDLSPKLFWFPELFSKEEYGGTPSDYFVAYATWTPGSTYPASVRWLQDFNKMYPDRPEPLEWAPWAYSAMKAMLDAASKSGPEPNALIKALEGVKIDTPVGMVTFTDSKNGHHQALQQYGLIQFQGGKKVMVYPDTLASTKIQYPMPGWKERK